MSIEGLSINKIQIVSKSDKKCIDLSIILTG